jgi:hypothetical protein
MPRRKKNADAEPESDVKPDKMPPRNGRRTKSVVSVNQRGRSTSRGGRGRR